MTNPMGMARAAMHTALQSSHGAAVTYHRGDTSVSVTAVIGRSNFPVAREFGVEWVRRKDFLIAAADLILDGAAARPETGDTIVQTIGADTYTYTVNSPGDEHPFRFSGAGESVLRIHALETDLVTST